MTSGRGIRPADSDTGEFPYTIPVSRGELLLTMVNGDLPRHILADKNNTHS